MSYTHLPNNHLLTLQLALKFFKECVQDDSLYMTDWLASHTISDTDTFMADVDLLLSTMATTISDFAPGEPADENEILDN